MKHQIHKAALATATALAFAFALQTGHAAQQQNNSQQNQQQTQQPSNQNGKPSLGEPQTPANGQAAQAAPAAPKVDPAEESAYQAFAQLKPDDYDQQIQQGEDFVKKYPQSRYNEIVYSRLVTAYYNKQETDKMYDASDKALAINANNIQVLALVGWVIPHNYDPNDPNAEKRLQKSEIYEQRALQILSTLPKPPNLTDEQFTAAKAQEASLAHSGLGLTYFREQKADDSLKELQQATATDKPDPVDLFIMGVDLDSLKRYNDAAQAFDKCAQIPGVMQSRCTEQETKAKAEAAQPSK
jgi:tetratricopeptide (TPR) repeat protein